MALPDTLNGVAGWVGSNPPHKSSGGNYYGLVRFTSGTSKIGAHKSTSPGSSAWTIQDAGSSPNVQIGSCVSSVSDGTYIHVVRIDSTDLSLQYSRFDMSSDTWAVTNNILADLSGMTTPSADAIWCSIALRAGVTGDELVIAASGFPDASMGANYERVDLWHGPDSGTPSWTGPASLDARTATIGEYQPVLVTGTGDSVHVSWGRTNDGVLTARFNATSARTFASDNTLGTIADNATVMKGTNVSAPEFACFNMVMQNVAGTDYVHYLGVLDDITTTDVSSGRSAEDVNNELGAITDTSGTVTVKPYTFSRGIGSAVSDGSTLYVLYSATDQDLYLLSSDDNADTWSAETELLNAVTIAYISAAILDTGKIAYLYDDGGVAKYNEYVLSDTTDDLLGNDTESASETTSSALGQTHAITALSAQSSSETHIAALTQEHGLLATSTESASATSAPVIAIVTPLNAVDVDSTSETAAAAFGQDHVLTAASVESAAQADSAAVGQIHGLTANDTQSASELSATTIGQAQGLAATSAESSSEVSAATVAQAQALIADDVESAAEVSAPIIGQTHIILASDTQSASEVSFSAVGQAHELLSVSVQSNSEITLPALSSVSGQDSLLANDVEGSSETSAAQIAQVHALLSASVESASETITAALGQIHTLAANDDESATELSQPALSSGSNLDNLLANDVESSTETSAAVVGQIHALTAVSVQSSTNVSAPVIGQTHILAANDAESASELSAPALADAGGVNALLADDIASLSVVTAPVIAQVHGLAANDTESAAETGAPLLAQIHILSMLSIEALTSVSATTLDGVVIATPSSRTVYPDRERLVAPDHKRSIGMNHVRSH